jgi:leader peptidase (prepilin peptidase)/N-methyltransferase
MTLVLDVLLPSVPLVAVLLLAGGLAGPFLARFASHRTVAMPLDMELEAETDTLVAVLDQLHRLPYLTSLKPSDFAAGSHARIWEAMLACAPEVQAMPEDVSEAECAERGRMLQAREEEFYAQVHALLGQGPAPVTDQARFVDLVNRGPERKLDDAKAVEAAQRVLDAGNGRNRLAGTGLVLPTATPDSASPASPPLQRVHVPPSRARVVATCAAAAVGAGLIPALVATTGMTGVAAVAAGLALLSLVLFSVVISLVDLDTFTIDLHTFVVTTAAGWVLAVVAAGVSGNWSRLLSGLAVVAGAALFFELGNKAYKLVRGHDGQGMGDTLIVLATAGIPAALTGSWILGFYGVFAGCVLGALGWTVGALRGKLTRHSPFAFGPYLAAGWFAAWLLILLVSDPSQPFDPMVLLLP